MSPALNTSPLQDVLLSRPQWSRQELLTLLSQEQPDVPAATLVSRLHALKSRGILHSVGRGSYTAAPPRPVFSPSLDNGTARLVRQAQQALPAGASLCFSDTAWLNALHEEAPLPSYRLIEANKAHLPALYEALEVHSRLVFLNPDATAVLNYVHRHERAVVLRPLISEAPLAVTAGVCTSPLEKLLVDALAHRDLYLDYQLGLPGMFAFARQHFTLNESRLRRYANRRDLWAEIQHLLYPEP
ncbi:DUF6577 family protein [Hymenobacter latericus]|uniref:DUF6577 family protein n=1 Tax=Hymenobacter sp. YIM 151858-1 TaxID=2987688 RepID=UPI0029D41294|nr:DUF6577 family protein [Hymenobacter sp. YIM 151858-1]